MVQAESDGLAALKAQYLIVADEGVTPKLSKCT